MLSVTVAWLAHHRARLVAVCILGSATAGLLAGQAVGITHVFATILPAAVIAGSLVFLVANWHTSTRDRPQLRVRPRSDRRPLPYSLSGTSTRLLSIAVCWLCLAAWATALSTGGRGPALYTLCALAGSAVLAQLLFARPRDVWPGLLLVQILLVAATVRLPALLITPSLTGVDIFTHLPNYAASLVETGRVDEALTADDGSLSKYVAAPLFHTLVAATALLGDVSVRTATTLSVGLGMLAILAAVYCIARYLGLDARAGLLATALVAGVDYAIHWSIHLIPSSLAVVFVFAALALLVRVLTRPASATPPMAVCFACLLVAIVLTDQVTAFIMVVILVVAVAVQFAVSVATRLAGWRKSGGDQQSPIAITDYTGHTAFLVGCVVVSWALTPTYGSSFLMVTAERGIDSLGPLLGEASLREIIGGESAPAAAEQGAGGGDSRGAAVMEYVARLGFSLMLAGAAIGTFALVRAPNVPGPDWPVLRGQPGLTLIALTAVLGFIALVPPLLGINALLPGRWYLYLYVFLAILTAVGLADVARQSPRVFLVCAIVVVCVFPLAGVIAPTATPDAPILDEEHPRYSYTASEASASETLREITVSSEDAPVRTDQPFQSTLTRPGDGQWYTLEAERTADGDISLQSADSVIYREYQTTGAPHLTIIDETGPGEEPTHERDVRQIEREEICTSEHSIGYDNGEVTYCER